ncbi:hypothetical protein L596_023520 [Steinernema carpocapsae]|uniref:F-box domain-containing protein n=1 Tax=Steinernema carpocapsae TaxID=34508 RepID=A0A4U5MDW9_STECR|nr:hypothetical protein L596_023520 [Steinernema carpocapsae]
MSLSLDGFSDEVLERIFESADRETLLEVRRVSERFNKISSKVLRDKKLCPVRFDMDEPLYLGYFGSFEFGVGYIRDVIFTIPDVDVRSEDFDLDDFLPEFMVINWMEIKGRSKDERFADAAKILDCIPNNWSDVINVTFGTLCFSPHEFQLVKAMENKLFKKLYFSWSNSTRPKADVSREIKACLAMFRSNQETLKLFDIKGHFSVAELIECCGQVDKASFVLSPHRVAEGDLNALPNLIESLVANPRTFELHVTPPGKVNEAIIAAWEPVRAVLHKKFFQDADREIVTLLKNETWNITLNLSTYKSGYSISFYVQHSDKRKRRL